LNRLELVSVRTDAPTPSVRHPRCERKEEDMARFEYKVLDTGKHLEAELNRLGAQGWQVVGVTTKKQLFIAPPQAIILMRMLPIEEELETRHREAETAAA
jgi:hypothetical protein